MRDAFRRVCGIIAVVIMWSVVPGCQQETPPSQQSLQTSVDSLPEVVVTSYPLFAMVSELAGDDVTVTWLAAEAEDPRHWIPDSEDVGRLQSADLVLLQGANYESWTNRVTLPRSRTHDVSAAYSERFITQTDAVDHQHGPKGDATSSGVAWNTWLNPELCAAMLSQVSDRLCRLLPSETQSIREKAINIRGQLDAIHEQMQAIAKSSEDDSPTVVLADGPFYEYLAEPCHWKLHHVAEAQSDASFEESTRAWKGAMQTLKPQLLLCQKQSSDKMKSWLKQQAIPVATIDLCEAPEAKRLLVERLTENVTGIKSAVGR